MKPVTARAYEEIPECTREYAEFVCNTHEAGCFAMMAIEDERCRLHECMAAEYGLKYEDTRDATFQTSLALHEMTPERMAIIVDCNLRRLQAEKGGEG
jgi:hypothetical protein